MRAAVLLPAIAIAISCTNRQQHLFGAFRFETDRKCLEAASIVDVLDGPDPGHCPSLKCWVAGTGGVFVTDQACDAPPDFVDHTFDSHSDDCVAALLAYKMPNKSGFCGTSDAGM